VTVPTGAVKGDVVERYHALLTDALAQETQAQLDDQLRRRGLFFGDRALCTVLRPRFLGADEYRFLQRRVAAVVRAFRQAHAAALADDAVLDQFRLEDWERRLVRRDPGFAAPSPVSRIDAFFAGPGGIAITEYNAETPAGAAYNDVLTEVFLGLPAMRPFFHRYDVRALPARHNTVNALLETYHEWSGRRALPRVAILDWEDVPTRSEFLLFQDYLERNGVSCVIASPTAAELRDGKLYVDGEPVDLIYKRVLLHELVDRLGEDNAVLRAVHERAVCMVNPPACKILHKKASLAVLSDERNAHVFDDAGREAIAMHVPWTRVVEERRTHGPDGDAIDLVPWAESNRERLVLKPNDDYGGKGIVLGWEVDADAWRAALAAALREPYIVQQRITLEKEPYPSLVDGRVVVAERMVDTAPYVARGAFVDGVLTRLGTASLLNVTAGGGSQVPTFVVEKR